VKKVAGSAALSQDVSEPLEATLKVVGAAEGALDGRRVHWSSVSLQNGIYAHRSQADGLEMDRGLNSCLPPG
jgi:hypothetical protein